jgi:DNA-directed RNA polymerase subunit RPC12/RpoP
VPSSQKGGTKIVDEVKDWEAHLQRLETVDGYRPGLCDHCGCRRLHGHGRRVRVLAGDDLVALEIRRYRCVECGAVWQVLPGFVARQLWRRWEKVDEALQETREERAAREGPPRVPGRTVRRWRSNLQSCGRRVLHVLSVTGRPEAEAAVQRVPVECTRNEVLAAYRSEAKGTLAEVASLLHRAAPGVRMM